MSTANLPRRASRPAPPLAPETVADLLARLGGVPADRVRWTPTPGTATEADVVAWNENPHRTSLCELVEGTLVEKAMGYEESAVACNLIQIILNFVRPQRLGRVLGEGGMQRVFPGRVRLPDVSFLAYARFPRENPPPGAIAPIVGDLVVEVLSKSNTKSEIAGKLSEYFAGGTRLAWVVDPRKQTARAHTSPTEFATLTLDDTLDGGDVLPGLLIPVRDLFDLD